jgi:hypothetical protein
LTSYYQIIQEIIVVESNADPDTCILINVLACTQTSSNADADSFNLINRLTHTPLHTLSSHITSGIRYNWNLVCNGGLLAGAIAFVDAPGAVGAAAASVYANATEDLHDGFSTFGPDGGWAEGTTYWGYATKYVMA